MELLKQLNPEQKKSVTHGEGPLLIVAGAGTGKTTVITQRIAWLIAQGKARSDEILAVTFTDKAAGEMEERVDRLLPLGYLDLWISTFHSFCQRVLQDHALDIGLPRDFKLLDQTAQWLLIRQNLDKFDLDYYRPLGNPTKFIHALLQHFSRAKDEAVLPDDYYKYVEDLRLNLDTAESTGGKGKVRRNNSGGTPPRSSPYKGEEGRLEEVAKAYHMYQQILLENNALDFGDLINYTLRLFKERPKILEKYRQQFKYILVDEFQDTNWAQHELIKLLAAPANNLTVVGDDDQSIYKFRGASISNIMQFRHDFPKAEIITIATNYRSRQQILDESHKFIELNNPNRLEAQSLNGKKIDKKLKATHPLLGKGGEGGVESGRRQEKTPLSRQSRDTSPYKGEEGVIEYILYEDQYEEAQGIAEKIIELKNTSPQPSPSKGEGEKSWNDFAVLVRANALAEPVVAVLEAVGIPYQHLASRGLYTKPIILDIINFLKLLDDYHESPSLWRVLNWPVFNFKSQTLVGINHHARKKAWSLYQAIHWWQHTPPSAPPYQGGGRGRIERHERDELKRVIDLIEKHTNLAKEKRPREVILSFLEDSGYLKWLANKESVQAVQQLGYLEQFDTRLKAFETEAPDPSIKNFMDEIRMELESGETGPLSFDPDVGPEAVKVMTIHAAKGLEFRYVFIIGLVDKRFPSLDRRDPIELPDELIKEIIPEGDIHLQEERRLMYVAMTRAKEGLYLTAARDYGGKLKKKPSRFLYELGLVGKESPPLTKGRTKEGLGSGVVTPPSPLLVRGGAEYQLPKRYSFTQMQNFQTCPYQYRFSNILRVPTRANFTLSFGKTMHETLRRFFELIKERDREGAQGDLFGSKRTQTHSQRTQTQGKDSKRLDASWKRMSASSQGKQREPANKEVPSVQELLDIYEEQWLDDWYESSRHKEEYREKGKQILKDFHAKVSKNLPQVEYLEQGFNLKLQDPESKEIYSFFGVIDRIDALDTDEVEIIDYKTGTVKTEKTLEKDQLLIYQIAVNEVLGLKPKQLTFYYLNENKPVSFLGTDEELEKMKQKMIEFVRAVRVSDFRATPSPHKCKHCDYRNICEYRAV